MTAKIADNVARNLSHLGINGVVPFDESHPDRLFCWDTLGELKSHCETSHWYRDIWDPLHGKSTRHSWREKDRPSMQVCEHAISQINHPTDASGKPLPLFFYEIDFDKSAPESFTGIFIHGTEVLINALTDGLTDQNQIAAELTVRYEKEVTA